MLPIGGLCSCACAGTRHQKARRGIKGDRWVFNRNYYTSGEEREEGKCGDPNVLCSTSTAYACGVSFILLFIYLFSTFIQVYLRTARLIRTWSQNSVTRRHLQYGLRITLFQKYFFFSWQKTSPSNKLCVHTKINTANRMKRTDLRHGKCHVGVRSNLIINELDDSILRSLAPDERLRPLQVKFRYGIHTHTHT